MHSEDSSHIGPHTLSILCTYQCNAACKQCCFESNPSIRGRLSEAIIRDRINEANKSFPSLRVVVFTGGEALLLREALYNSISHCTSKNLHTRVVSNGHWGKTESRARATAERLALAGLGEINLSTGEEHREWVPVPSIIAAAIAATDVHINTLITIEHNGHRSDVAREILENPAIRLRLGEGTLQIQSNSWVPFHSASRGPTAVDAADLRRGCDQIFGTLAITPRDHLSACCGLTLEHIPELRLGSNDGGNMRLLYESQLTDFLKIWIHTDGPYAIIERLMGEASHEHLRGISHICEACAILHKNPSIGNVIRRSYTDYVLEVMTRFHLASAFGQLANRHLSRWGVDT